MELLLTLLLLLKVKWILFMSEYFTRCSGDLASLYENTVEVGASTSRRVSTVCRKFGNTEMASVRLLSDDVMIKVVS